MTRASARDKHDWAEKSRLVKKLCRDSGIDLFVLPYKNGRECKGQPYGTAWVRHVDGVVTRRFINVMMPPESPMFFHVALHEFMHHALGDTDFWTSTPYHMVEYRVEKHVLGIARNLVRAPHYTMMVTWAKRHIFGIYKRYADSGLWMHLSKEIAEFCGYEHDEETLKELTEREA